MCGLIMSTVLIPTIDFLADAQAAQHQSQTLQQLKTLCANDLERFASLAKNRRGRRVFSGTQRAVGLPQIRYSVLISDTSGDGGIPNQLSVVHATEWFDQNRNRRMDANELSVDMLTKVAK
ncbi:MAG: hypothetical protein R3C28_29205 [Pirellulaceae bacterium]